MPLLVILLFVTLLPAQVVFSRRVYSETGRTYQQLWTWDGKSFHQLTNTNRDHLQPVCSPAGITFSSGDERWRWNSKTKRESKVSGAAPAQDRKVGLPAVPFAARSTPLTGIGWSANRKWFLAATQGENDNSTARQSDFFVLDTAGKEWKLAGSGNNAIWIPGRNEVLFSTPRDLIAMGKHQVWSSHLVVFDPVSGTRKTITSGVTHNIDPAPCRLGEQPANKPLPKKSKPTGKVRSSRPSPMR